MLDFVVKGWDKHHLELREAFARGEFKDTGTYKDLLSLVCYYIFPEEDMYEYGFCDGLARDKIQEIDYGAYQGTLILVIPMDTYQPMASETYYTIVEYGSCSGCDTLLHAHSIYDKEYTVTNAYELKERQIDAYMSLALHLLQHLKSFEG